VGRREDGREVGNGEKEGKEIKGPVLGILLQGLKGTWIDAPAF